MRVLHICSGNLFGGVETFLVTLARLRHLCPEMEPHFSLCFHGRFQEELTNAGVPIYNVGYVRMRYPWTVCRARNNLANVLRDGRFDVAICHSAWSQVLFGPTVRKSNIPLVFWAHNPPDGRHWLELLAKRVLPDLVICNSQFCANSINNLYSHLRYEVLYYPVILQLFDKSEARIDIRRDLQINRETVVIIQTSRMEEWKGQRLHLEALGVLRDVPGWICWQVGGAQRPQEKRYFQSLQQQASDLGIANRVRFWGQRGDVPQLLIVADIHCQPNVGPEPFGITFIEALYAGLPVVTMAMGGALEIVNDACGILVPPNDKNALAAALKNLVADRELRLRLGSNGPARARQLCDPQTQINKLYSVLQQIIN